MLLMCMCVFICVSAAYDDEKMAMMIMEITWNYWLNHKFSGYTNKLNIFTRRQICIQARGKKGVKSKSKF